MNALTSLGLFVVRPTGSDLWAFWVLVGVWVVILSFVWAMVRWLRDPSNDEGQRGL
jgi:hypothetical protein